jgi:hypothetical protein
MRYTVVTSRDIVSLISKEQRRNSCDSEVNWIWSKSYCIYRIVSLCWWENVYIAQNGLKVVKLVSGPESQPEIGNTL